MLQTHPTGSGSTPNAVRPLARHRQRYPEQLTGRERDVLRLVAQAASTGEIADQLGISTRTVECHLQHVYAKLGVRGRCEAILWTMQGAQHVLPYLRQAQPST
jgi:DNA-binding CsgD family transcriptional regulator